MSLSRSALTLAALVITSFSIGSRAQSPVNSRRPADFDPALQNRFVSFGPYNAIETDNGGTGLAIADLDKDGSPDAVIVSASGVRILFGDGQGGFHAPVVYTIGAAGTASVAIGDFNDDKFPDIAVAIACNNAANCQGAIRVLLNNGDGTFQAPVTYALTGYQASSVVVGDVDGDGILDIVATYECGDPNCDGSAGINIFPGKRDGTFGSPANYSWTGIPLSVAVADLNGDHHPDIVLAGCDALFRGMVGVFLNDGHGNLNSAGTQMTGGPVLASITTADLNGDGAIDLAAVDNGGTPGANVWILLGDSMGGFSLPQPYPTNAFIGQSIVAADINGDGHPDLIAASVCAISPCRRGVASVLAGVGDGTFMAPLVYPSYAYRGTAAAVTDVNGDNRPDLFVLDQCAGFNCQRGGSGGAFELSVHYNILHPHVASTLTSSLNPSLKNQQVTFTATLTSTPAVPDGEVVTFYIDNVAAGSGTTLNGVATFTTPFPKARYRYIKAVYPGDAYHRSALAHLEQMVKLP
jgi:FG-GAP-like repeat/Bacterial Ig-like domain (group 3)